jgi:hypothetical protein
MALEYFFSDPDVFASRLYLLKTKNKTKSRKYSKRMVKYSQYIAQEYIALFAKSVVDSQR